MIAFKILHVLLIEKWAQKSAYIMYALVLPFRTEYMQLHAKQEIIARLSCRIPLDELGLESGKGGPIAGIEDGFDGEGADLL